MTGDRLSKLQEDWERLAQDDPLWAILTTREKRGGRWDPGEFFASGESDVAAAMSYVERVWPSLQHGSALDFGCGVGRLTQALARRFESATGVDISPTMIELARQYDGSDGRCQFVLNPEPHLQRFEDASFDFILSLITLQHIRPDVTRGYLQELVRVLRPGGLLLFQLPSQRRLSQSLRDSVAALFQRFRSGTPRLEMHGLSEREVVAVIESADGRVVDRQRDGLSGPGWVSLRYAVMK